MFELNRTYVLVADGARARLFVRRAAAGELELLHDEEHAKSRQPARELGSDEPGRPRVAAGTTPHSYAPEDDRHEQEKRAFARALAHKLDEARRANKFEHLVVVAPPRVLGELREALEPETARRITRELARDFTHVPAHELPRRLQDALA